MVKSFLTGLAIGSVGALVAMQYHVVRTDERIMMVARVPQPPLRSIYVDVRRWSPTMWQHYPELAEAVTQAGHENLLAQDNSGRKAQAAPMNAVPVMGTQHTNMPGQTRQPAEVLSPSPYAVPSQQAYPQSRVPSIPVQPTAQVTPVPAQPTAMATTGSTGINPAFQNVAPIPALQASQVTDPNPGPASQSLNPEINPAAPSGLAPQGTSSGSQATGSAPSATPVIPFAPSAAVPGEPVSQTTPPDAPWVKGVLQSLLSGNPSTPLPRATDLAKAPEEQVGSTLSSTSEELREEFLQPVESEGEFTPVFPMSPRRLQ